MLNENNQIIINYCKDYKLAYIKIQDQFTTPICNAIINNIFEESDNGEVLFYYGSIAHNKLANLEMEEKYYLAAINKHNIFAMYSLGYCYERNQSFELAEKYYLMMINHNDINQVITINPIKSAIKYASKSSINYYNNTGQYEKIEQWYKILISKGCKKSFDKLHSYYKDANRLYDAYTLVANAKDDYLIINTINDIFDKEDQISDPGVKKSIQYTTVVVSDECNDKQVIKYLRLIIYKMTSHIPKRNIMLYYNQYNTMITMRQSKLPHVLIVKIAGHLFD